MAMNSAEEDGIIDTVLGYCEAGGTHMQPDVMHNPVRHYTDPQQLEREIDVLFREFPIIVGHASQLASVGDFLTHDATGVPLLVTRNPAGDVKAMVNVCRHRGARVVSESCGQTRAFTCPYHSWTYDLDGQLKGLPQPIGFGALDRQARGLVEVPAFERFGLIWVRPTPGPVAIDAWLEPMAEQLASLSLENHSVYRQWSIDTNMSWRIALEGFQESYHFCSAHKHTACSAYLNNQSVFLDKYPHVRHAVPVANVARLQNLPAGERSYRAHFMTQNYLFPCNFVQVMTDHVYVHTIAATGPGTCVFQCTMLVPEPPLTDKAKKHWDANYQVVRTVFAEDFAIGEGIQQGFAANVNDHFLFGRYEAGLQLGQRAITDALEGRLTAASTA